MKTALTTFATFLQTPQGQKVLADAATLLSSIAKAARS